MYWQKDPQIGDEKDSGEILSAQLERLGYDVLEAPDRLACENVILSQRPDLIIMDLGFRHMNGIEAAARLRKNPKTASIPIIAYTVWDKEIYQDAPDKAGITKYLTKPTPPEVFREVIEKLLQRE